MFHKTMCCFFGRSTSTSANRDPFAGIAAEQERSKRSLRLRSRASMGNNNNNATSESIRLHLDANGRTSSAHESSHSQSASHILERASSRQISSLSTTSSARYPVSIDGPDWVDSAWESLVNGRVHNEQHAAPNLDEDDDVSFRSLAVAMQSQTVSSSSLTGATDIDDYASSSMSSPREVWEDEDVDDDDDDEDDEDERVDVQSHDILINDNVSTTSSSSSHKKKNLTITPGQSGALVVDSSSSPLGSPTGARLDRLSEDPFLEDVGFTPVRAVSLPRRRNGTPERRARRSPARTRTSPIENHASSTHAQVPTTIASAADLPRAATAPAGLRVEVPAPQPALQQVPVPLPLRRGAPVLAHEQSPPPSLSGESPRGDNSTLFLGVPGAPDGDVEEGGDILVDCMENLSNTNNEGEESDDIHGAWFGSQQHSLADGIDDSSSESDDSSGPPDSSKHRNIYSDALVEPSPPFRRTLRRASQDALATLASQSAQEARDAAAAAAAADETVRRLFDSENAAAASATTGSATTTTTTHVSMVLSPRTPRATVGGSGGNNNPEWLFDSEGTVFSYMSEDGKSPGGKSWAAWSESRGPSTTITVPVTTSAVASPAEVMSPRSDVVSPRSDVVSPRAEVISPRLAEPLSASASASPRAEVPVLKDMVTSSSALSKRSSMKDMNKTFTSRTSSISNIGSERASESSLVAETRAMFEKAAHLEDRAGVTVVETDSEDEDGFEGPSVRDLRRMWSARAKA